MLQHQLRPLTTRIKSTCTQPIENGGVILPRFLLISTEASLDELRLRSIWLESALSIKASAIDVHLPFVAFDSILIETLKLRCALSAQLTPSTVVLKDGRSIAHQLG